MALKRETREQVGLKPPNGRNYVDKRVAATGGVAVHYPGADTNYRGQSHDSHRATMRAWQQMHMARGSRDLEYGSVICPCGIWMEGRTEWNKPLVRVGSNGTSAANSTHTSVQLMIGSRQSITQQEKEWIAEAIAWLRSQGWGGDVSPHSRFYATACPGDSIRAALPEIRRLADGTIPTPGPITDPNETTTNAIRRFGMFIGHSQHNKDHKILVGPTSARKIEGQTFHNLVKNGVPYTGEVVTDETIRDISDTGSAKGGVAAPGLDEKRGEG